MKDDEGQRKAIDELAHNLIRVYKWRTIDRAILVARVLKWIEYGALIIGEFALERLCEQAAAEQIYKGCALGIGGYKVVSTLSRSEQSKLQAAYTDLAIYLEDKVKRLKRPIAPDTTKEDLLQNTLGTIFEKLGEKPIEPRYFFAWAMTVLNYKRLETWRDWNARNRHTRPFDDNDGEDSGAAGSSPAPDEEISERDFSVQSLEFFRILGECLDNDEERVVAIGLLMDMKRRDMQMIFTMLKEKYDSARLALLARLQKCYRLSVLLNTVKKQQEFCTAKNCPLQAGGRS